MIKTLQLLFLMLCFSAGAYAQCVPTIGVAGATGDYINNFTFGTISNLNSGDAASDYTLFPMTGNFVQGLSYPFTIQTGSPTWGQGLGMWIDFDGNNSFLDPGEFVWASPTSNNTSANILSGNITIPITAVPGLRRVRTCCYYVNLVTQGLSCGHPGFGEFEDYNITILANTPCAGTPTGGTTVGTPPNPCPGVSVTFSLNGASLLGGLSYQWLRSLTGVGGSWTPILGATNPTHSEVPPVGTSYYRCIVTCTNPGGGFDTSIAYTNTTQPFSPTSPCYCNSLALNSADEEITNVTMGTLNNTTDCLSPLVGTQGTGTGTPMQYANFTAGVPAPILYIGQSQAFSVTAGSCSMSNFQSGVKIYIDYNHNTSFSDPGEEVYFSGLTPVNSVPATVLTGSFIVPVTALPGLTRMRVIDMEGGYTAANTIDPCLAYGYGETEDYAVNIVSPAPHDPAVVSISGAPGNCHTANQTIIVSISNYGSSPINLATNPVTCTLSVNGPLGITPYYATLSAGTLNAYGTNNLFCLFTGVNMYAGGTYYLNTTLSIGNAGGVVNGSLINDSLPNPEIRLNYRPTAGPDYPLCQYASIPFGQGLSVSGCATPINDSVTITFTLAPVTNPTGANVAGSRLFASAILPALPPGSTIGTCDYIITNLAPANGGFALESRFPIFSGGIPVNIANVYWASVQGNPGIVPPSYNWVNNPTANAIGNLYNAVGAGGTVNLGYHSTWAGNANNNGMTINAGGQPTVATLKIRYQYVPSAFEWYNTPVGGASLYSFSPFNPITTPGSGITNSNTPGTYPFYAACVGSSACRVPVNLIINPTPLAFQDTLALCENPPGSNGATFDLTTMDGPVSGFVPTTTVEYFGDQGLFSQLTGVNAYLSGTSFVYSKVSYPTGCYSSDSLLLQVNGAPEFPAGILTGSACAPASIDVATLIDPFTTVPAGCDTLYYADAACTILHPNPHNITSTDTVWIVLATLSTNPVCSDTAVAYIELSTAGTLIANQDILNFSIPGFVGCNTFTLTDGNTDTLYNPQDCKRIVHITDLPNATDLGSTQVCEWIDASTQYHNGQPYINRHYQITPSTQTSAQVCLYFLEDDFAIYNADAIFNGWPQINPNVNLCISQVDNGDIMDPGHTAISIPNAAISATYDPGTTIWTVCFPVDSFSYFYCHTCNPMNTPLPVSLLSFTGKKVDNYSLLNWVTASEQNNSHFILEHSRDGKAFSALSAPIASQAPNGSSSVNLNYSYTDYAPYSGYNYYRLQQVDLDQKVSYSQIVKVYHGNETLVNLYPNPVNTQLNIEINTPQPTLAQIKIMDATGRVVKMIDMQLQAGNNKGEVSMEGLADGIYMIKITNNKGLNYSQTFRKN